MPAMECSVFSPSYCWDLKHIFLWYNAVNMVTYWVYQDKDRYLFFTQRSLFTWEVRAIYHPFPDVKTQKLPYYVQELFHSMEADHINRNYPIYSIIHLTRHYVPKSSIQPKWHSTLYWVRNLFRLTQSRINLPLLTQIISKKVPIRKFANLNSLIYWYLESILHIL